MTLVGAKEPIALQSLLTWPLSDTASAPISMIQVLAAQAHVVKLLQVQEMQKVQMAQQQLALAEALHHTAMVQEKSSKRSAPNAPHFPAPPGLAFSGAQQSHSLLMLPPGLELPRPVATAELSVEAGAASAMKVAPAEATFEGSTMKVSWRVGRFVQQLASAMGRPLVSPCLRAEGLSDAWIMVEPCSADVRGKEQRELFRRRLRSGPLDCRVKVKLAEAQHIHGLLCRITIGSRAFQAFSHNFTDEPLLLWQPTDFDWSTEVGSDNSVEIGIEFAIVEKVA
jgi:hypothetical protein